MLSFWGFPDGSDGKASACNAGDPGLTPGSGRSLGEGNGTPLQYSRLENPMDGGAGQATVRGVPKSRTRLSDFTFFSFFLSAFFLGLNVHPTLYLWVDTWASFSDCEHCYERGYTNIFLRLCFQFFWVSTQKWNCWVKVIPFVIFSSGTAIYWKFLKHIYLVTILSFWIVLITGKA